MTSYRIAYYFQNSGAPGLPPGSRWIYRVQAANYADALQEAIDDITREP